MHNRPNWGSYDQVHYFDTTFGIRTHRSHSESRPLRKLREAYQMKNDPKSGKSRRVRGEGSGPKIKKSTIQNADNLEMKGGSGF